MNIETRQGVEAARPLAEKIKDALARQGEFELIIENTRQLWIAATLDVAKYLAEARECFPSNQEFGEWLNSEGLEISKDQRAAYIALGQEPERAAEVLQRTQKTSVRKIVSTEFRLRTPAKTEVVITDRPQLKRTVSGATRSEISPGYKMTAIGEPMSCEVQQELQRLRHAVEALEKENASLKTSASTLKRSISEDEYRELEAKILFAEEYAPWLDLPLNPLTEQEYLLIFKCLHPDVIAQFGDPVLTDRFTEAFRVLKDKRKHILQPDAHNPYHLQRKKRSGSAENYFAEMMQERRRIREQYEDTVYAFYLEKKQRRSAAASKSAQTRQMMRDKASQNSSATEAA
jgi:hypothetical protein